MCCVCCVRAGRVRVRLDRARRSDAARRDANRTERAEQPVRRARQRRLPEAAIRSRTHSLSQPLTHSLTLSPYLLLVSSWIHVFRRNFLSNHLSNQIYYLQLYFTTLILSK